MIFALIVNPKLLGEAQWQVQQEYPMIFQLTRADLFTIHRQSIQISDCLVI